MDTKQQYFAQVGIEIVECRAVIILLRWAETEYKTSDNQKTALMELLARLETLEIREFN